MLLDDLQVLLETANGCRETNQPLSRGIAGFLNLIWEDARPGARLAWVLAGHRNKDYYQSLPIDILLWPALRELPIDFVSEDAVALILNGALSASGFVIPGETTKWVHNLTAGYPEAVQMVGESMFLRAKQEKRNLLTPDDAHHAAQDVASWHTFLDTWYPRSELSETQRSLLGDLIRAVPVGGKIEAFRLVRGNKLTREHNEAISDLIARKILDLSVDGNVRVKAYILDLWLHGALPKERPGEMNGSVAIFIDVANLTKGTGATVISLGAGDVVQLIDLIDQIERFARTKSPIPPAAKWAVNYPLGSSAVLACNAKDYQIKNIPEALYQKASRDKGMAGADDVVLREKVYEVEQDHKDVNHFVLVTGDIDYSLTIDKLLRDRKNVYALSWAEGQSKSYLALAKMYPGQFVAVTLEDLLSQSRTDAME